MDPACRSPSSSTEHRPGWGRMTEPDYLFAERAFFLGPPVSRVVCFGRAKRKAQRGSGGAKAGLDVLRATAGAGEVVARIGGEAVVELVERAQGRGSEDSSRRVPRPQDRHRLRVACVKTNERGCSRIVPRRRRRVAIQIRHVQLFVAFCFLTRVDQETSCAAVGAEHFVPWPGAMHGQTRELRQDRKVATVTTIS